MWRPDPITGITETLQMETRPLLTLSLNEKLVKIDIMLDGLIKKLKKDMAKIK